MDNGGKIGIILSYPRVELLKNKFRILFGEITAILRLLRNLIWHF